MKVTVINIDESDIPIIRIGYFKSCEKLSLILFNDMISKKKIIYYSMCFMCGGGRWLDAWVWTFNMILP